MEDELFYGNTLDDHAAEPTRESNGDLLPLLALIEPPSERLRLDSSELAWKGNENVQVALLLTPSLEIQTTVWQGEREEILYLGKDLEEAGNIAQIEASRLQGEGYRITAPNPRVALHKLQGMA